MSYTINHYNGQLITSVADGTIDSSLDVTLVGKNYAGYGQLQNENLVYLLENFANPIQPAKPVSGQIWYDSGTNKLKFYDGSVFRTTGNTEIGTEAPTGLSVGDFWFNTVSNQLYAYTGTDFALIGPQAVVGSGTTQMQTTSVMGIGSETPYTIIQAINGGATIFIISGSEFTLDGTINPIDGFDHIYSGITLNNTRAATAGVTSSNARFHGTSTNADKLGGVSASNFVQAGSASFNQSVHFVDLGYTMGTNGDTLRVWINDSVPTIVNQIGSQIVFQTTSSVIGSTGTKTPLLLQNSDVLPGYDAVSDLGAVGQKWKNVYAGYVYSTSERADSLLAGSTYVVPSSAVSNGTLALRDSSGDLYANTFRGISTNATTADSLKVGTVYRTASAAAVFDSVAVRNAVGDLIANNFVGVATNADTLKFNGSYITTSTASLPTTIAVRTPSGDLYATAFRGIATNADSLKVGTDYRTASVSAAANSIAVRNAAGDLYATIFRGISTNADTLKYGGVYITTSSTASADTVAVRTNTGDLVANLFYGTAVAANYADLAEKYLADAEYEIGTVVMIGGEKEVTACTWGSKAIGAVSGNPAYLMNKDLVGGTAIALKGRVPVKVIGRIKKGDELIASNAGCASFAVPHASRVFAVALESSDDEGVKIVECLIL